MKPSKKTLANDQQAKKEESKKIGGPLEEKRINLPFEVTTCMEGPYKKLYDAEIDKLKRSGLTEDQAATYITNKITEGLKSEFPRILKANGINAQVFDIILGKGGYTNFESGNYEIAPNINIKLAENTTDDDIESVMNVVNLAADQQSANGFRYPTKAEILNDDKDIHHVLVFEQPESLDDNDFKNMALELNGIKDENGNPFLTGHTNFGDFIGISGHSYKGNFSEHVMDNIAQINGIFEKFGIDLKSTDLIKQKVFSYERTSKEKQSETDDRNRGDFQKKTKDKARVQQESSGLLQDTSHFFEEVLREPTKEEITSDKVEDKSGQEKPSGEIQIFKSVA